MLVKTLFYFVKATRQSRAVALQTGVEILHIKLPNFPLPLLRQVSNHLNVFFQFVP